MCAYYLKHLSACDINSAKKATVHHGIAPAVNIVQLSQANRDICFHLPQTNQTNAERVLYIWRSVYQTSANSSEQTMQDKTLMDSFQNVAKKFHRICCRTYDQLMFFFLHRSCKLLIKSTEINNTAREHIKMCVDCMLMCQWTVCKSRCVQAGRCKGTRMNRTSEKQPRFRECNVTRVSRKSPE